MGTDPSAVPSRPAPGEEAVVQAFIHERFIELFLSQNRRAQWSLMAAAVFIFFAWSGSRPGPVLWAWLVAVLAYAIWRLRASEALVRSANERQATWRVGGLMGGGGALLALSVLGFSQMPDLTQAAVSIVLLTVATGSVISTAGYRNVFLAYAIPLLVPLALGWVLTPHAATEQVTHWGLGLLVLLYLGFLLGVARQQAAVFEESCRIRFAEKKLNAQLKSALESESEAHRSKTQFLAAASHDLRQPIHSMNVLVAALSMRDLDERSREITRLLGTVNQTLAAQLDALLDISRLDAGTVTPARSLQQLERLVAEHYQLMEPGAASKGLRCQLTLQGSVPVRTDPSLLLRIVSNLTDNAIKYNRPGGELAVRVWREESHACLAVADTGIGIDGADQAKVFREFYQVDNVERDRTKGLGLGLSIVQRLAALLDIQVELESAVGKGTTVTLRMPLAQERQGSAEVTDAPAPSPKAGMGLKGLRVLVVDDDTQVRQSMEVLLSEVGCQVHVAAGTPQACDIAGRHTLDVLLTDLRLQAGDDGLQVLQGVRSLQPGLRAALITGETAPDRLRQAQGAGVPLLHKPVTLDTLRAVLEPPSPR